jgi:hypothetical protein
MARKKPTSAIKNAKRIDEPAKTKKPKPADTVYQFKITLIGAKPTIWRRVQVTDCTLDKLHEHIQTAMGWTNSHLHHFRINDRLYGDPVLMAENMEEMRYKNSTKTMLSDIVPQGDERFRFLYEYDFGDSWEHEVVFEKRHKAETGRKYPLCLKGARACPPEDVGGVWGYVDFVQAIQNEDHEQHEELLGWVGRRFDPEDFNPDAATKSMQRGLPDWRRMM